MIMIIIVIMVNVQLYSLKLRRHKIYIYKGIKEKIKRSSLTDINNSAKLFIWHNNTNNLNFLTSPLCVTTRKTIQIRQTNRNLCSLQINTKIGCPLHDTFVQLKNTCFVTRVIQILLNLCNLIFFIHVLSF